MEHRRSAGFKRTAETERKWSPRRRTSVRLDAFSSIAIHIQILWCSGLLYPHSWRAGRPSLLSSMNRLTVSVFACSVALTAVLSGYATVFQLCDLLSQAVGCKGRAASSLFYERTAFGRWAARRGDLGESCTIFITLAVLGFEMLSLAAAIVCASLVGVGALIMMITTTSLHRLATDEPAPPLSLAELANSSGSEMTRSTTLTRGSGRGFPGVLYGVRPQPDFHASTRNSRNQA